MVPFREKKPNHATRVVTQFDGLHGLTKLATGFGVKRVSSHTKKSPHQSPVSIRVYI